VERHYYFDMGAPKIWTSSGADAANIELSDEAAIEINTASRNLVELMVEGKRVAEQLDKEIQKAIAAGVSVSGIRARTRLGRDVIEAVRDGKSSLTVLLKEIAK
jgi:hypothetical protein